MSGIIKEYRLRRKIASYNHIKALPVYIILGIIFMISFIQVIPEIVEKRIPIIPIPSIIVLAILLIIMVSVHAYSSLLRKVTRISVEDDDVRLIGGIIWKYDRKIPYSHISEVSIHRGPLQRALDLASIWIYTPGTAGVEAVIGPLDMKDAVAFKEGVRDRVMRSQSFLEVEKPESINVLIDELRSMRKLLEEIREILKSRNR